ncbi:probable Na(+)/H(+) antiporter nhx-9 isoform X2 [Liolophura sinensis]|uniref:probable Na(+)/H(+) antiporter nhx-9 isoform X2 n=1 Tax=Liolophura sinensis TaxID=3198878 RepID=UPI0031585EF4
MADLAKRWASVGALILMSVCLLSLQTGRVQGQENSGRNDSIESMSENETETPHGITVAKINFEETKMPFLICVVVLLAALSKIVFHHVAIVSSKVPESCLLIVVGVITGAILHFSGLSSHLPHFFEPHEFFLYLLPPIILEASFSLHSRVVFNNLGSILTFAVMGTVLACFAVGYTMYGLNRIHAMGTFELGAVEILIFSSLIVAVDPVAVLAVFEEVGVNNVLYFMVFGESLLNDGVTVVLYNVMHDINAMDNIGIKEVLLGILTFLVVAGVGAMVGVVIGLISAIVTKYTYSVRVVEPIAVFIFAYMSYIVADIFSLSGIISMIACGVVQMKYTFRNIAPTSATTIKYFTKVLSTATEIVIFLFLGLSLVSAEHNFQVGFVLWAILLTLVYRFIITFGLSFLLNKDRYRVRKISLQEQFIISYGGLRGAVAFSLVGLLQPGEVQNRNMFVTATLAVIIFTVFVQGITIKPLVRLLEVKMASTDKSTLFEEIIRQMTDNIMSGVEDIMGYKGNYHFKASFEYFEDIYLKKWLLRKPQKSKEEIMRIYQKVVLRDHVENLYAGGAKIPQSPALVRALGDKSSDLDEMFAKHNGSPLDKSASEEIQIQIQGTRRRHQSDPPPQGRKASMTSQDMIRLLHSTGARNILHLSPDSVAETDAEPDLLHHLQDRHKRVRTLNRHVLSWQPDYIMDMNRHPSWHGPRYNPMFSRLEQNPRPLSSNFDSTSNSSFDITSGSVYHSIQEEDLDSLNCGDGNKDSSKLDTAEVHVNVEASKNAESTKLGESKIDIPTTDEKDNHSTKVTSASKPTGSNVVASDDIPLPGLKQNVHMANADSANDESAKIESTNL